MTPLQSSSHQIVFLSIIICLASTYYCRAGDRADLVSQLQQSKQCVGCDLSFLDLSRADLTGVNFSKANLDNTRFCLADLSGAIFRSASLKNADFAGADISNAVFVGANLTNTSFSGAYTKGAVFSRDEKSELENPQSSRKEFSKISKEENTRESGQTRGGETARENPGGGPVKKNIPKMNPVKVIQ